MSLPKCVFSLLLAATMCFLLNIRICCAHPGLQVQITQKGLNYANEFALRKMHSQLKKYSLPDVSKKGWISYYLYGMKVQYISEPRGKLVLIPKQGMKWIVNIKQFRMKAKVTVSKKIAWFRLKKTYAVTIVFSDTKLGLTFIPTKAANGGLDLKATHCISDIDVKINIKSIVLKVVIRLFRKKINKMIESRICESAVSVVNKHIAKTLANYPVTVPIGRRYVFDYGLETNPVFTSKYLRTNHKATISQWNKKSNFPFAPKPLPTITENKNMVYFIISDFVFNTWFYSAYQNNHLKFTVKSENIKKKQTRELFKTSCPKSNCIGRYLPKISNTYPNSKIEIVFSTYKPASVHFKRNKINADIPAQLDFSVVQSNGTRVNFLTSKMALFLVVKPTLKSRTIVFKITNTSLSMGKTSSKLIDNYTREQLQNVVNIIVKSFENSLPGFKFPLVIPQNTLLSKPTLRVVKNAIIVSSDLRIISI